MIVLERMARVCGALAALFLCLIGVVVTAQIVARLFSMQIPASDDFAGWFMAASIFLALPYAMLRGDHIRVSLLLQVIPER
ncbi:TRAP transporter small permease, partial [Alcaligenes pakistanensis]